MIVGLKTEVKSNAEILSESVTRKGKGSYILNVTIELFQIRKFGFLLTGQMITNSLEFSLCLILNDSGTYSVMTYPNYQIMKPVTHTFSILTFRLARAKPDQSD